ncbi:uncharacterized protein TRIVIDRAFT_192865 [Trichoderma virens Gv29-8]|uniref:Uncharacterized protein n=1 Tax=Hypocrea virens (strain Gv29-8 / FGSC 10586) TaxID=413071 RepID=G9MYU0_HYPVG|nr:uncharacterized protein TRIVIDRAFT_192865 [Trichoderma virens Gv29-8]EHK20269.1 hypothetical protein TRIVIDRAFT_192865 [Trichoderma virens Gv29-8]
MRSYIYTYKARSLIHSKPRNTKNYENKNPYDAYNVLASSPIFRFEFSLRLGQSSQMTRK